MLARMKMDPRFLDWNRQWGAPFGVEGQSLNPAAYNGIINPDALRELTRHGLFAAQPNNSTRLFEYPWAYFSAKLEQASMKILEIGGGLSGFQFVLSREGHLVDNADPGMEQFGFQIDHTSVDALNSVFGTRVNIITCPIENAPLREGFYDRAFSLSVIEHLAPENIEAVMDKIHYVLKPGGLFVLTVDLFLDLVPFTGKSANKWGRNIPITALIDRSRFEMVYGRKDELFGFEEFDAEKVLENAHQYFIGRNYPTMIQTLVLRRN